MKADADVDAIVEATRGLEQLIVDCETVARDQRISATTHNRLIRDMAGFRSALVSEDLSLKDLYGLIEEVYWETFITKEKCTRFDARHPEIIKHLSKAKDIVLKATGQFHGPKIIEIDIDI